MNFTNDIEFNNQPATNENLTITYHGFLKNSESLTIVYGYNSTWENTTEKVMTKTSDGFSVQLSMPNFDTFNFCFKNNKNQWDNNSNCNYISPIFNFEEEDLSELLYSLVNNPKHIITEELFNIDLLIQELLEEPLNLQLITQAEEQIINSTKLVDLSEELSNAFSQIEYYDELEELEEFSTLEEILSATTIENTENIYDIESGINLEEDVVLEQVFDTEPEIDTEVSPVSQDISNTEPEVNFVENDIFEKIFDTESETNEETNSILQDISNIELEIDSEENTSNIEPKVDFEEKSLININDPFILVSPRKLSKFYLYRKRIKLAIYKIVKILPKLLFGYDE